MDSTKAGLALPLILLGLFALPGAHADDDVRWLESDGVVVFEAESATLADGWVLDTEIPGFTGTGYLRWGGENHYRKEDAGEGTLTFRFTLEQAGNYQLLWRSRIALGDDAKEHNDSWARLDGGTDVLDEEPLNGWTKAYMNDLDSWSWATKTLDGVGRPLRQHFDAGTHTLYISGRSTGHAIDRVVLIRYEEQGYGAEKLDALPVSDSTSDGGTTVDPVDGDEAGVVEETGGGGGDGASEGGTSGGEPIEPRNADVLDPEDEGAEHVTGECFADVIELAPLADVHESADGYVDTDVLEIAGDGRRALLRFALDDLPPISSATLRYTAADAAGSGELALRLGSRADWQATGDGNDAPDALVDLGSALSDWRDGIRYESVLDVDVLPRETLTLLLETAPGDALTLLSSDDPARGPRLRVGGGDGFCDAVALSSAPPLVVELPPTLVPPKLVDVPVTPPSTPPEAPVPGAIDPVTDAVSTGEADGGSTSAWLLLPLAVLGLRRRSRRRGQRTPAASSSASSSPRSTEKPL